MTETFSFFMYDYLIIGISGLIIVISIWKGFINSILSLLTWIVVSLTTDFDRDRAMPMAPFLAIAAIGVFIGSFYYPEFFHLLIIQ